MGRKANPSISIGPRIRIERMRDKVNPVSIASTKIELPLNTRALSSRCFCASERLILEPLLQHFNHPLATVDHIRASVVGDCGVAPGL